MTLLATKDSAGASIAPIDGSTWDPFARRLLFTTENANAPIYAATPNYPSTVTDISGALGRGGYEGVQDDSDGNIWIVEDSGGAFKGSTTAKRPNSFVYRYVPRRPGDLTHGKLQVLQVRNEAGDPITFESQQAINSPDQLALHTYHKSFATKWITIHDTATDGTAPFQANAAAKAAHGTPFKRPENGQFRPGEGFKQFFFDETADTDATSPENANSGGWGSIFKLTQRDPSAPVRWLAEGRDPSATIDSANGGFNKNEGDNEITGVHVSNGDHGPAGILGAQNPRLGTVGWRWFYTQQHGDNPTYEVLLRSQRSGIG